MHSNQRSYSSRLTTSVLRAMSLFSGLQMVNIICSVVKIKLVALWLHASGIGLFGIYQSVIDTVSTLSDVGLRQSAVRDVAMNQSSQRRLAEVAIVVRKWSTFAGLLGATVIVGASPLLSQWFFHSWWAVWGFVMLGIAMFLNSLTSGEQALLQGSGKLRALARGNLWGTVSGFIASVPLFYFLGPQSVALSIVAYSIAMYASMRRARLRTVAPPAAIGLRQIWMKGKGFARLGLYMAIAAFVTSLAHTIFTALLNATEGIDNLGYVQAGDTIIVRYLGLIFTAIGMEFYPRLAAARHKRAMQTYVNHEIVLLMILLTPLLILFIMARGSMLQLLYTNDFMVFIPFITWGALASIPKAISWCMAFTIICRGDGKIYVLTETLDAIISVPLCYLAFKYHGFAGLGIAYIIWYLLYALLTGTVFYCRYGLQLNRHVTRTSILATICCLTAITVKETLSPLLSTCVMLAIAACFIPPLRRLMRR